MRKLILGYNDLLSQNPKLAEEWDPTKNGELTPDKVTAHSSKKVWWRGSCKHEWQATILNRNKGSGCPYCAGQKVLKGFNDLATKNPELANEWHPTKNGDLTPEMVTAGSHQNVWWQCSKSHEWETTIYNRNSGSSCPYCSGKRVLKGFNDLATINPQIASEWHPTKNGDITPDAIMPYNSRKVWWQCSKGHEWQATVADRSSKGNNCPYCSGRKVLKGFNDLATVKPELASEWHPTKNNDLTPDMVTANSQKKVWWQCSKGHEWEAKIYNRNHGNGCPYCSGHSVLKGFNDLVTVKPELAAEWHPTKNGDLTPDMITVNSNKKVWWQCANGHEWQTSANYRKNYRDSKKNNGIHGCPYCTKKRILKTK